MANQSSMLEVFYTCDPIQQLYLGTEASFRSVPSVPDPRTHHNPIVCSTQAKKYLEDHIDGMFAICSYDHLAMIQGIAFKWIHLQFKGDVAPVGL